MTLFGNLNKDGSVTETCGVNLNNIPSSDPLAFSFGIHSGVSARNTKKEINHGCKHNELAPEYLRGFLLGYRGFLVPEGTKIKKGEEQSYALFSKKIEWK